MSRIRVYEDGLNASDYITKGLDSDFTLNGANSYEVGKFGAKSDGSLMLIPSKSLLASWRRLCTAAEKRGLHSTQQRSVRS